jgi:hypothetical protein
VAFFRFSRDKRGYEHFYLVEPVTNRKGKSRPRVLYWYRTPPNVKVGRVPFDDEVRHALEAQYPDVTFDWTKIVDAPIPSAEADKWRERRRNERAERAARRSSATEAPDEAIGATAEEPESADAEGFGDTDGAVDAEPANDVEPAGVVAQPAETPRDGAAPRKRRRRRRGRAKHAPHGGAIAAPAGAVETPADAVRPPTVTPPDDPIDPSGE